jgi:hypothetical protein
MSATSFNIDDATFTAIVNTMPVARHHLPLAKAEYAQYGCVGEVLCDLLFAEITQLPEPCLVAYMARLLDDFPAKLGTKPFVGKQFKSVLNTTYTYASNMIGSTGDEDRFDLLPQKAIEALNEYLAQKGN